MKQYTERQFEKVLKKNGFKYERQGKGDHRVYMNSNGVHVSIPYSSGGNVLSLPVARRLIKENGLIVNKIK